MKDSENIESLKESANMFRKPTIMNLCTEEA